jgi:hypothetical protein
MHFTDFREDEIFTTLIYKIIEENVARKRLEQAKREVTTSGGCFLLKRRESDLEEVVEDIALYKRLAVQRHGLKAKKYIEERVMAYVDRGQIQKHAKVVQLHA